MYFADFAFQAVPATDAPAQTTQPVEPARTEQPAPSGFLSSLPFLIFIPFVIYILWQGRSQQKKQDALVASLKKGDKVVIQGGIIGRLAEVEPKYARVEIAPGVKIQVLRSSLLGRDTGDATPQKGSDKVPEASQDKS